MFGPDVAIQGYLRGVVSGAVRNRAVDHLLELPAGPLHLTGSLHEGYALAELGHLVPHLDHELPHALLESGDFCCNIVVLCHHQLQQPLVLQLGIWSIHGIRGMYPLKAVG